MKKQTILLGILSVALLAFTACSNDKEERNDEPINTAEGIEFKVDFSDYNTEEEVGVTRAVGKDIQLDQEIVDLGNGIYAECTLQRDTTKQTKQAATRALSDDTYTMLAYDATTHTLKGELTGKVVSGVFTATSANKGLYLPAGNYDFVLFNSKVNRNNNQLTVSRANADAALIARTTKVIAASPIKQEVSFSMKHAGAKVSIKLLSDAPCTGAKATLSSVDANSVSSSSVYDASTGNWTSGAGETMSANLTYPNSTPFGQNYVTTSSEGTYFLSKTNVSKFTLKFTAGKVYNIDMATAKTLTFQPTKVVELVQNGAYTLTVKLAFGGFLYLMDDGKPGTFKETVNGGGSKHPVALILSRSKRIAVALKDVKAPVWDKMMPWCENRYHFKVCNSKSAPSVTDALSNNFFITTGYEETWNPRYSVSPIGKKGENPSFISFKYAAKYEPEYTYSGNKPLKWYLPSCSDWKYVFSVLGFGDGDAVKEEGVTYPWSGNLANKAFTQVGGDPIINKFFWTSTEIQEQYAGLTHILPASMRWTSQKKSSKTYVRPFVQFYL